MPASRIDIDYSAGAPRPRPTWPGFLALIIGLTLIAPPLSVLYKANDESLRTGTGDIDAGLFTSLYRTPQLVIPRPAYTTLRAACTAAALNALLLAAAGAVIVRKRETGLRLLAIHATAHLILTVAVILFARRFSAALDDATARLPWYNGTPYGSATAHTAAWAAVPALIYPLALAWLYTFRRRSTHRRRRLV